MEALRKNIAEKIPDPRADVDDELLHDEFWHVNTGQEKIHALRIKGRFRNIKWLVMTFWGLFFIGPYIRWGDRQAVLFDIPGRKFHIFSATIWPQDIWMLSLLLLFLALSLFATTAIIGRAYCGYLCFQTAWTDIFTLIEQWCEGPPPKRRKLDNEPLGLRKLRIKSVKHTLWLIISVLTGYTFAAYFADAFYLAKAYLTFTAPAAAWITLGLFIAGTYILAGFMREQVCMWLCPYARIQGVMTDQESILPTYDFIRGEPRSRLKDGADGVKTGDCIDCNFCVAVCPMGVDIRYGQQEGCITCGICIDACNVIMDKIKRPRGLIRYVALSELEGKRLPPVFKRPRVFVYSTIITLALAGIIYGLTQTKSLGLNVLHERQPLFVRLSDGSIQNKYTLKIVNKTEKSLDVNISLQGPEGIRLKGVQNPVHVGINKVIPVTAFATASPEKLNFDVTPVKFRLERAETGEMLTEYKSMFLAPKRRK